MLKHGNALSPGQLRQMMSILASQFPLDMDTDVADRWIKNPTAVGKVLRDGLCLQATHAHSATNSFRIIVNYAQSLAQMISAAKFDWVNSDITDKHFPIPKPPAGLPPTAKLNIELLHFNRSISSEEVLKEMKQQGYRPATLPELLAFGATYPEEQKKYPIVALGSVWRSWFGYRDVACLDGLSGGRSPDLSCFGGSWYEYFRFAAVREPACR